MKNFAALYVVQMVKPEGFEEAKFLITPPGFFGDGWGKKVTAAGIPVESRSAMVEELRLAIAPNAKPNEFPQTAHVAKVEAAMAAARTGKMTKPEMELVSIVSNWLLNEVLAEFPTLVPVSADGVVDDFDALFALAEEAIAPAKTDLPAEEAQKPVVKIATPKVEKGADKAEVPAEQALEIVPAAIPTFTVQAIRDDKDRAAAALTLATTQQKLIGNVKDFLTGIEQMGAVALDAIQATGTEVPVSQSEEVA